VVTHRCCYPQIKAAVKVLNGSAFAVCDYMHTTPALIMDVVQLLIEICGKASEHVQAGTGGEVRARPVTSRRLRGPGADRGDGTSGHPSTTTLRAAEDQFREI